MSLTLHEAIAQTISLGEHDPRKIAEKVRSSHGDEWLSAELLANAGDLLAEMCRRVVSSNRRSSVSLARRIDSATKRDLMLEAAWLPGIGWVQLGKFTSDDFDRLSATYRKGASALNRYADWADANAATMRAQGAAEFRQVKGDLPGLAPAEAA